MKLLDAGLILEEKHVNKVHSINNMTPINPCVWCIVNVGLTRKNRDFWSLPSEAPFFLQSLLPADRYRWCKPCDAW